MTNSSGLTRRQAAGALIAGAGLAAAGSVPATAAPPKAAAKGGNYLLRGGYVMTMDAKAGDIADADVLVKNGKIAEVGKNLNGAGVERIDARNMIVMPGLIDTHTHMWNAIWRSSPIPYIENQVKLGPHYRPDDSYNAVKLCAVEMLSSGITTVHAWEHNCRTPGHVDAELKALSDTGMRTLYSYGYTHDTPNDKVSNLEDMVRARKQWQNELITVGFASRVDGTDGSPASPWPFATPEVRKTEWEFARREKLPITHHVSGPRANPEPYVALCGPDTLLVHGYHFPLEVWQTFAKNGVRISLAPYSAAASYRTPAPFRELAQSGVQISLSFDNMNRSGNADLFRTMVIAWTVEQLRTGQAPTFRRMLELATIEGAKALNMGEVTGSLTPGKSADLIAIRLDQPNVTPMTAAERLVMWSVQPANVDTVMVAGRIVKRGGEMRVADARKVAADAGKSMKYLLEKASVA
jgi:cytosine/adenosine deaminase-related metal-dependent hydrolase